MKDTVGLSALLVTVVGLIAFRTDIKLLDGIETRLQAATSIGAVAFVQAVLNGNAMVEHPMVIKNIVKQKSVRIVLLVFTAFSIIHDLELAVLISLGYMLTMQLLRTPEERKQYPYMI